MHLLYLTFGGNAAIHAQASFSIYTFIKAATAVDSINIITDAPTLYQHLGSIVKVVPITKGQLQEWEGEQQFFWRVKLKAIEQICRFYPGEPVMYLDTDTLLIQDVAALQNNLLAGNALMHENEGPLSAKKSKTEKRMWQQLKNNSFGGLPMQPTDCMWNAGVVATPNIRQATECTLAISICDEMCKQGVTRRLIEQYALSLALQHTYGLLEARESIVHYWTTKEFWNQKISDFFLKAYFSQWTSEQVIHHFSLQSFETIPIAQYTKNTNIRIKKWADRFFPSAKKIFLTK